MLSKIGFDFKKQEKKIFVVFILGLIFYALLIFLSDINKVAKISQSFNWRIVIILLILSLLNYLFRFFRWHYFLHRIDIRIPFLTSIRIFFSGLSMTVTPGKMGEVIKAYLIKKETGNKFAEMVPLLITERLTDGIGMILLAAAGIYLFQSTIVFFILAIFIVSIFFIFILNKKLVLKIAVKLEKRFGHIKILDFLITFFENSNRLIGKPLIIGVILSLFAWMFEGVSLFILINYFGSFFSFNSLALALLIFSFSSIAGFIVLIPGGIGVAEGSITSLLTLFYGFNLPQAIFITLLFRFATLWFGVTLGLVSLFLSVSKH